MGDSQSCILCFGGAYVDEFLYMAKITEQKYERERGKKWIQRNHTEKTSFSNTRNAFSGHAILCSIFMCQMIGAQFYIYEINDSNNSPHLDWS